eukprot:CAMPEP_0114980608 /NCGR_PEP_ID=MMETSP0216-20121206/5065_1 /TAXON_ID=223996 /ORGANISM="Protocruzia adherens, Strain Boccale" /LENGTH=38 /DNA_ID= /DNA_START= /DNA_END= /DNA_ORIENTATION=
MDDNLALNLTPTSKATRTNFIETTSNLDTISFYGDAMG